MNTQRKAFRQPGNGRDTDSQSDKILDDVRGYICKRFGGRFEDLAEVAGLHPKTVESFAWGDTRLPQFQTIVRLLSALDLYHDLKRLLAVDKPMSRVEAAGKR